MYVFPQHSEAMQEYNHYNNLKQNEYIELAALNEFHILLIAKNMCLFVWRSFPGGLPLVIEIALYS